MNILANVVKPIGADREQIDAWVDVLDRAEPDQTGWRTAFDRLKEELIKARRLRWLGRIPAVVGFCVLVALYLIEHALFWNPPGPVLGGGTSLIWILVLTWEFAVRRAFPVLEIEGRVAALLRYYGAKDVPTEEEVS
jgi:hypothetical protein